MQFPITLVPGIDGGFTSICGVFPVTSEGDTMEEALENIQEAIECHLEGLEKYEQESEPMYKYDIVYLEGLKKATNAFVKITT